MFRVKYYSFEKKIVYTIENNYSNKEDDHLCKHSKVP